MAATEYWNWVDGVYISPPHEGDGQKWQPVMTEVIERHADVEFEDFDDCKNFYYDSGWIYYTLWKRGKYTDYKMRIDGTELQKVEEA